jgi:hypothetical protein
MMNFSLSAILACISFYSALYMIYYFFAHQSQAVLLFGAVGLLILSYVITPPAYKHRERSKYNSTLSYENFFTLPLFTWWRLFSLPVRLLLSKIFD